MFKILYGGIPQNAVQLIKEYTSSTPSQQWTFEEIGNQGLRARIKRGIDDINVSIIILGLELYSTCEGSLGNVLQNSKVHKFVNMKVLQGFLNSQFSVSGTTVDEVNININSNTSYGQADFSFSSQELLGSEFSDLSSADFSMPSSLDSSGEVERLRSELDRKEQEIYRNLGKVAKAEEVLKGYKSLQAELGSANEQLRVMKTKSFDLMTELNSCKGELQKRNIELKGLSALQDKYSQLLNNANLLKARYDSMQEGYKKLEQMKQLAEKRVLNYSNELDKLQESYDEALKTISSLENSASETAKELSKLKKEVELIDSLRVECSSLRLQAEKVDQLNELLSISSGEISSLKEKAEESNKTIVNLETSLEESKKQNDALLLKVSENDTLAKTIEDLDLKVKEFAEENATLKASILDVESSYKLEVTNSALMKEEIGVLQSRLEKQTATSSVLSDKCTRLQDELDKVKSSLEEANLEVSKNSSLSKELDNLRLTHSDLSNKFKLLLTEKDTISNKVAELETQASQVHALNTKLLELRESNHKLNTELNKSKATLEGLNDVITEKDAQISKLTGQLQESSSSIETLRGKITSLQAENLELEQVKVNLESRVSEDRTSELADKLNALILSKSNLEKELEEVSSALVSAEAKSKDLEVLHKSLESKYTQLLNSRELLQGTVDSVTSENLSLKSDLESLRLANANLEKSLGVVKSSVENSSSENSSLHSTILDLESKLLKCSSLETEYKQALEKLELSNSRLEQAESEKASLEIEVADLNSLITDFSEKVNSLEIKLSNYTKEDNNSKSLIENLTTKNESLVLEVQSMQSELELCKNNTVTPELELELTRYKTLYSSTKSELESTQAKLDSTLDAKVDLQDKLDDCLNKMNISKARMQTLEAQLNRYKETESQVDSTKLSELSLRVESSGVELMSCKKSLELAEKTIESLKSRLALQDDNTVSKDEYEQALLDVENLWGSISVKDSRIATLEDEVSSLKQATSATSNLKDSIDELRLKLKEAETSVKDKEEELDEVRSNIFYRVSDTLSTCSKVSEVLFTHSEKFSNITVVASGNSGSLPDAENFIFKEVSHIKSQFLVVNLVNESALDLSLKCSNTENPTSWLLGVKKVTECLGVSSANPNVRLLTVSSAMLNEAYLLNINWLACLKELDSLGLKVIINIGQLGSLVHSLLFNTFNKYCKTVVVVKSKPSCMRATLINLSSYEALGYSLLVFVDFQEALRGYFENFKKYKTCILDSSKILQI
jgi:chromosome segregation ATPase